MSIKRRFEGWRDATTGKAVNVGDVLKNLVTGEYYSIEGFCQRVSDKPDRVKAKSWDKRATGMAEVMPATDFGIEYV